MRRQILGGTVHICVDLFFLPHVSNHPPTKIVFFVILPSNRSRSHLPLLLCSKKKLSDRVLPPFFLCIYAVLFQYPQAHAANKISSPNADCLLDDAFCSRDLGSIPAPDKNFLFFCNFWDMGQQVASNFCHNFSSRYVVYYVLNTLYLLRKKWFSNWKITKNHGWKTNPVGGSTLF